MTTNPVYITNLASFLPNEPVGNDEMESVLGQVGPRPSRVRRTILRNNGIKSRHYAIDPRTGEYTHTNAALTAEAIRGLSRDGQAIESVDCLAAGTTVADQVAPSHGLMVHGELGLPPCEVVGTSGICLSGISALKYACMGIATGEHRRSVATGSELVSPLLRADNFSAEAQHQLEALQARPELAFEKDFLRWMLSDGAGAVLLEPEPGPGPVNLRLDWIELISYAGQMETCMYIGAVKNEDGSLRGWSIMDQEERANTSAMAVKQDVKLLNEHIMEYTVQHAMARIREKRGVQPDDYDWFLPHYSSQYFRDQVYERMQRAGMEIPSERWFTNLSTKGNTGSASIYIMLAELFHSGDLKPGQRILCYIPESGRFSTAFISLTVE
jgi:3-oxoacyl-[acyl-carrier-protein] synthase-3